jgi:hypothetical protein
MKLNLFTRVLPFICLFLAQPFTGNSMLPMPDAQPSVGRATEASYIPAAKTEKQKISRAFKFIKRDKNRPPFGIWAFLTSLPIWSMAFFPSLLGVFFLCGLISFIYGERRYTRYLSENASYSDYGSYKKVTRYRRIGRWLIYFSFFIWLIAFANFLIIRMHIQ